MPLPLPSDGPTSAYRASARWRPRRITRSRAWLMVGALILSSGVALSMIGARGLYLGKIHNRFLIWNLILAWIPVAAAFVAYRLHLRGQPARLLFLASGLTWFLFFPNAPYIVTDFVHLIHEPPVPLWFDLLTIAAFAWTGLCLGYLSLYLMQEIVRDQMGRGTSWIFVVVMLLVGSAGIYAGRFLRWNSWDVVRDPTGLVRGGLKLVEDADVQLGFVAYVCVMFLFLLATYCTTFALTHLHEAGEGKS